MALDGRPRLNLASFVTTKMERAAENLMTEASTKNAIDLDEYPQTTAMQQRCVNMLARLFHAPLDACEDGTGTACVGSSEAIMLATLAMKWAWKERRTKKGLDVSKPNIVFGSNIQVVWHKACKYFEVESREANVSPDCLVLTAERAKPLVDENTIGVCAMLGSTYNGEYEDVKGIHDMLVALNKEKGWEVPLHVDAASGGFVAPFLHDKLVWDFQLPNVKSINVSGHKFGLVYAGIGWLVFREKHNLHPDLVFHVNYLGGDQSSFTLNFSKGAGTIVGQYYNLLRLGRTGYTQVMTNCASNAYYLREKLLETGKVEIHDKAHVPLVAFSLKASIRCGIPPSTPRNRCWPLFMQDKLSNKGWIVPAYTCPPGAEDLAILRVVVRDDFSRDLADALLSDMLKAMDWLEHHPATHHAKHAGHIKEQRQKRRERKAEDDKARLEKRAAADAGKPEAEAAAEEEAQPPLIEQHHIHSLKTDPAHRSTGEKTHGVC
ncbi:pyridoxal phosphate-dependent transferase [Tribonema minus]|uniref:Glutamate decarboxylase n=1 Tax=Tribonema minus TaxID=303371 RepID=A0A835YY78_9STRA|nr:pyridoxal phosphate-dependent transferase [Tribonema minus]